MLRQVTSAPWSPPHYLSIWWFLHHPPLIEHPVQRCMILRRKWSVRQDMRRRSLINPTPFPRFLLNFATSLPLFRGRPNVFTDSFSAPLAWYYPPLHRNFSVGKSRARFDRKMRRTAFVAPFLPLKGFIFKTPSPPFLSVDVIFARPLGAGGEIGEEFSLFVRKGTKKLTVCPCAPCGWLLVRRFCKENTIHNFGWTLFCSISRIHSAFD